MMELLPGGNILSPTPFSPAPDIRERDGELTHWDVLPEDVVVRRMVDCLRGVRHLHSNLVVHGDVKPSNLLLTPSGGIKVADMVRADCLLSCRPYRVGLRFRA